MDEIRSYYERAPEESRLSRGVAQLEAARTKELIRRHAPEPPGVLLDVGGGAGAYAFWLAHQGWSVHLVDASPRLVALAAERNASAPSPLESIGTGDARSLPFPDGYARCVLLLGPLYHLTDPADRAQALAEAARTLEPGGVLFVACLTRWASLLDGLHRGLLGSPAFDRMVRTDLDTGRHRGPPGDVDFLTTAYLHRPEEFEGELRATGLRLLGIHGLEGPAVLLSDFDERWADPVRRGQVVRAAEAVGGEPALRGLSAHLVGVLRR